MSGFTPKLHILDLMSDTVIRIPNFRGGIDFRSVRSNAIRNEQIIEGGEEIDALIYIRLSIGLEGAVVPIKSGEQFRMLIDAERDIDGISIFSPVGGYPVQDAGKSVFATLIEADPEAYEILR